MAMQVYVIIFNTNIAVNSLVFFLVFQLSMHIVRSEHVSTCLFSRFTLPIQNQKSMPGANV